MVMTTVMGIDCDGLKTLPIGHSFAKLEKKLHQTFFPNMATEEKTEIPFNLTNIYSVCAQWSHD